MWDFFLIIVETFIGIFEKLIKGIDWIISSLFGFSIIEKSKELWNDLIIEFCKAECFCYQGEPNWLGWIVIFILGVIVIVISFFILAFILICIIYLSIASFELVLEKFKGKEKK